MYGLPEEAVRSESYLYISPKCTPWRKWFSDLNQVLDSIVVSIPACHAGDRGSIPRRGDIFGEFSFLARLRTILLRSSISVWLFLKREVWHPFWRYYTVYLLSLYCRNSLSEAMLHIGLLFREQRKAVFERFLREYKPYYAVRWTTIANISFSSRSYSFHYFLAVGF